MECTLRIFACSVSFETKQQQNYTQKLTKMQQEYAQNRIYEPRYICWQTGLIGSVFFRKKLPVPPEPAPPAVDAAFKVAVIYELRKHILFKHGHGAGVEIEFFGKQCIETFGKQHITHSHSGRDGFCERVDIHNNVRSKRKHGVDLPARNGKFGSIVVFNNKCTAAPCPVNVFGAFCGGRGYAARVTVKGG